VIPRGYLPRVMRKRNGASSLCSVKPLAMGFIAIGPRGYCAPHHTGPYQGKACGYREGFTHS